MLIRLFAAAFLFGVPSAWAAPLVDTLRYSTDLYAIFEVPKSAGEGEFRASFRKLLMQYHPDRNPGDKVAEEISKRLTSLITDLKKANYRVASVKVAAPARPAATPKAAPPKPTPPPPEPPKAAEAPDSNPAVKSTYYDHAYARRAYAETEALKEGPERTARSTNFIHETASHGEAAQAHSRSSGNSCADRYANLYREI